MHRPDTACYPCSIPLKLLPYLFDTPSSSSPSAPSLYLCLASPPGLLLSPHSPPTSSTSELPGNGGEMAAKNVQELYFNTVYGISPS